MTVDSGKGDAGTASRSSILSCPLPPPCKQKLSMANVDSVVSCLLHLLRSPSIPIVTAVSSYAPRKCSSSCGVYLSFRWNHREAGQSFQSAGRFKFLTGPNRLILHDTTANNADQVASFGASPSGPWVWTCWPDILDLRWSDFHLSWQNLIPVDIPSCQNENRCGKQHVFFRVFVDHIVPWP